MDAQIVLLILIIYVSSNHQSVCGAAEIQFITHIQANNVIMEIRHPMMVVAMIAKYKIIGIVHKIL